MLSDISSRLTQVIEKRRLKSKIEQDLRQVEQDLAVKSRQLGALKHQLDKEEVDVEKLEGLSLTGLFYTVLGSKEDQVQKERQELLAAQLKYEQAKRAVDSLQADQADLERQMGELRGVDAEYSALLAEKESRLRQANPQTAAELTRLAEQIGSRNAEQREIDEAIHAAQGVLGSLERVIDSLQSAEGWGTWDMLGGGFLSTAMKHSRIDDAREAVQEVQAKMSRFNRELSDVQRSVAVTIDIGGLATFADYFFDDLITDWIVQSKIGNSLNQARQAKERITQAVEGLRKLREDVKKQVASLNDQRAAVIEKAS